MAAVAVAIAVVLQVSIGMNLIWRGWPLWLGTAHNAGAVLLVLSTVALVRALSPRSGVSHFRPIGR
jgi:heme A synthase